MTDFFLLSARSTRWGGSLILASMLLASLWCLAEEKPSAEPPSEIEFHESKWGYSINALKAKIRLPAHPVIVGSPLPVRITLRNDGNFELAEDGALLIKPELKVVASRHGWIKTGAVPLKGFAETCSLKPNSALEYTVDVADVLGINYPGVYQIVGGYDGPIAPASDGPWTERPSTVMSVGVTSIFMDREGHPLPELRPKSVTVTAKKGGIAWGKLVSGLRCGVSTSSVEDAGQEKVLLVIEFENKGGDSNVPDGMVQLIPHLYVIAEREGWAKMFQLPLDIKNRLFIPFDDRYSHAVSIEDLIPFERSGAYRLSAGYLGLSGSDMGDWTWGDVRSATVEVQVAVDDPK
jgi:hypothetical protein